MTELILNVDDREVVRYTKTRVLQQVGFEVVEAADGRSALAIVEERQPSVVLLDVRLPDMDGLDVCRRIKERWPSTMVLQTSASFVTGGDRVRGLDAGADGYLIQPVEPEELVATVRALLRIRQAETSLRALNDDLERRVDERTRDLAAALEELQREVAQREKMEAQLVQSQKMEAVGHLTGGIAHDFNNLLTAIIGNLDIIASTTTDQRIARLAANAVKSADRGSKLTGQLLAFARTQQLHTQPTDVNAVIRGMTELLDQSLGPEVTLRIAQGAGIGAAFADPNQLELAILNLAINARDAMPEGGTLSISTAEREVPPGDPSLAPGTYVVVDVADTGGGMPPDILAQAFDPFFTTKPAGKGTGLGLSQVYGIAKQSGGEARIVSAPCKGTTVSLWLRRATDQPIRAGDSAKGTHGAPQSERILLVDDDPDVSQVVHEFLVDLGYEVRVANHGAAALEIIQAFAADLAIIDFAMPGGNGADVAKAVRQWRPALPILFMSGYADTKGLEGAVGEAPLLHKPFRPAELAASVRNALGSRIEVPPAASAGED